MRVFAKLPGICLCLLYACLSPVFALPSVEEEVFEGLPSLLPSLVRSGELLHSQLSEQEQRLGPLDSAEVDLMILYTPAALSYMNSSGGGVTTFLNLLMSQSQLVLNNSLTYIDLNLVYSGLVTYTESGDAAVDLLRLTSKPGFEPYGDTYNGYTISGYMDEIHDIRDIYGADLILLLENVSGVGGIGWLLDDPAGYPDLAMCICRVQQATSTTAYTPIHELGHNMGTHHHKAQNYQPGPGLYPYSAGWRWTGTNGTRYCDVMTYTSGTYFADGLSHSRVPYFSNPSVSFQGYPTGDAADGDNARGLRESKHVVAAYRTAFLPEPDSMYISRSTGNVQLQWEPVSYANSYQVWQAELPDAPAEAWTLAGSTSETQLSLPEQDIRFYRVKASTAALP